MLATAAMAAEESSATVVMTTYPLELKDLRSTIGLAQNRASFRDEVRNLNINEWLGGELTSATEKNWRSGFWGAQLTMDSGTTVQRALARTFEAFGTLDPETERRTLEALYDLFPTEFVPQVKAVAKETTAPKIFAMCSLYLLRAEGAAATIPFVEALRAEKFPEWENHPILTMLNRDLLNAARREKGDTSFDDLTSESLRWLFGREFLPGHPVVFCIQRRDRNQPGMSVVRKKDGRFSRNPDGSIFHITHLARAKSNLPGYITNGNTPKGIFVVTGLGLSWNQYIGRTPFLNTWMPWEATPERFFHRPLEPETSWTIQMYREKLAGIIPASANEWEHPMMEAYYAGKAGRSDILAHGTTIDVSFYEGKSYYPNTPSAGCICAKEIWDPVTGQALVSDQLALVNAFVAASLGRDVAPVDKSAPVPPDPMGYFVVLELDGSARPVALDDFLLPLLQAESR